MSYSVTYKLDGMITHITPNPARPGTYDIISDDGMVLETGFVDAHSALEALVQASLLEGPDHE